MRDITRAEAIEHLRRFFLTLVDEQHSLCQVVGQRGIFCGGLAQWSFEELDRRFPWIRRFQPDVDHETLLKRANTWLLHRQHVPSGRLPCDAPGCERAARPCHGWDEFYESELGEFCTQLLGESVRVVPDAVEVCAGDERA